MKCGACYSEIKRTANYCENCGHNESVVDDMNFTRGNSSRGQKLIFTGLMLLCGSAIYYFSVRLIVNFTGNWKLYETIEYVSLMIEIVSVGAVLLIALGLNSGERKTLAIIFAAIYTVIQLYWIIERLFPDASVFDFFQF